MTPSIICRRKKGSLEGKIYTINASNPCEYIFFCFLGDEEITGINQTNKTEDDNSKKWAATSILEYTFTKQQNGKLIKCVALHEAYPTKSRNTEVSLDVQCKSFLYFFISCQRIMFNYQEWIFKYIQKKIAIWIFESISYFLLIDFHFKQGVELKMLLMY
jgi:hypothetical protein